jgi:hypothetical protein
MTWGKLGKEIASKLEGITDEYVIKAMGELTIQEIKSSESPSKRSNALKMVSREILKKFPRRESKTKCYYYDPAGRGDLPKWRHLIFKYLTLDSADWQAVREESQLEPTQPIEQPIEQPTERPTATLKSMTIEQLEFDPETTSILKDALEQSGMELAQFIQQAVRVYAKTITGKSKKRGEDLATVPTDKLLNDPSFSTHPGRAEELTKRAIQAIKYYNANVATENADRWCITQSAIAKLTGSKPATIGKILEQYFDEIETHNQTYGLNDYSNRKRDKKIEDLNFAEYVPDGLG